MMNNVYPPSADCYAERSLEKSRHPNPFESADSKTHDPNDANSWTELTTPECATLATPLREDQPGFEVVPDTRFGVQAERAGR